MAYCRRTGHQAVQLFLVDEELRIPSLYQASRGLWDLIIAFSYRCGVMPPLPTWSNTNLEWRGIRIMIYGQQGKDFPDWYGMCPPRSVAGVNPSDGDNAFPHINSRRHIFKSSRPSPSCPANAGLIIRGLGVAPHVTSGWQFTLHAHFYCVRVVDMVAPPTH